jgi:SET domain-containing protein
MPMMYKTYVAASNIHGLGLFAGESIPKNSLFWKHDHIVDGWLDLDSVSGKYGYSSVFVEHINYFYCYDRSLDLYIKHADNIIFANHSDKPNLTSPTKYLHISNKDIEVDEEITLNYRDICDDGFKVVEEINDRYSKD